MNNIFRFDQHITESNERSRVLVADIQTYEFNRKQHTCQQIGEQIRERAKIQSEHIIEQTSSEPMIADTEDEQVSPQ